MGTANYGSTFTVANIPAAIGASSTGEGEMVQEPVCPVGWAGPISTDTDRVITTTEIDPVIVGGDTVAIFWADGMAIDVVQSVTGGSGQVVKLSSGGASAEGDALPSDAVACIIAVVAEVNLSIPSGKLEGVAVRSDERASISFRKAADAVITTQEHTVNIPYGYISGLSFTDPVGANDCIKLWVATASITSAKTVEIGILYDSV